MPESKVCIICNSVFYKPPNRARARWEKSLYCGSACARQHLAGKNKGKRGPAEDRICDHCGKLYGIKEDEKPSDFKDRRFCSRDCANAWMRVEAPECKLQALAKEIADIAVDKGREAHLFGKRRFEDARVVS